MKTNLSQRICALVCLLAMLTMLAACSRSDDNSSVNNQSYTSSYINIPKEITRISRLQVSENTAYLCCAESDGNNKVSYIAAVNINSGDFQKLPLDIEAVVSILDFSIAGGGTIWALCNDSAGSYSLRKLDSSGAVLKTVDLSDVLDPKAAVASDNQLFLSTDAEGNIGVAIKYASTYMYVFDAEGAFLFDLYYDGNLMTTVTTAEGKIGVCSAASDRMNYNLLTVDVQNKSWGGNELHLGTTSGLYGGQTHSFLLYDSSNLYGYNYETGERQVIFSWSDAGLSSNSVHISELEDGRFVVVSASTNQASTLSYELAVLEQGSDDRTVLTMASLSARPSIVQAVSDFNKTSAEYRIELTEYFPYEQNVSDDDWENAITNLNTKIISGDIPDIIDMSDLSVEIYYNKGIVEDLSTYIENDLDINMEDYFENVFDAISMNGELPYITNGIAVYTMAANSNVVAGGSNWTLNDLTSLIEGYGANSFGNLNGSFLLKIILQTSDSFVDWTDGKCYFDTSEFIELLELASKLQDSSNDNFGESVDSAYVASYEPVLTVFQIAQLNDSYKGNLNMVGLPSDEGEYHAIKPEVKIGISTACSNKDGAWSFLRTFLLEDQQESCELIPIHKGAFNTVMQSAIDGKSAWTSLYENVKATQGDVDIVETLVSSADYVASSNSTLEGIVLEEAAKFFSGSQSAGAAASSIQNRATLYINEQM